MSKPKTNGTNGRKSNGQFAKGNPGGPGNPFARRIARLRATLLDAVGEDGLSEIVQELVSAAKGGDVQAAKLVLSYTQLESCPYHVRGGHQVVSDFQRNCSNSGKEGKIVFFSPFYCRNRSEIASKRFSSTRS